ncbi:MAG: PD40 domain-containing protein, partial [Chloroflexi bacterium]|nr:PD40 domain-containing protein [Chloroflexota bacterium]
TQWYERARFEWHPNQSDPAFRVLLGLLGNELRGPYSAGSDLPLDAPWVRTANRVIGIADGLPTLALPQNPAGGPPNVVVAPSGKRIAYTEAISASSSEQRLVVLNLDSGVRREVPLGRNGLVFGSAFSPDSERLAYSVVFSDALGRHEFRVLDLASGNSSVRLQGSAGPMPVVVAWNRGGLFVRKILYASDAPPQGLFLVDLQANTLQTIYDGINYGAEPSPDGQKIALVTGELAIGSPARTMLAVLDRATGRTTTIEAQAQQFIGNLSWSPDSSRIMYSRTLDNSARISTINVSAPDGTAKQAMQIAASSFPGENQIQDLAWHNNQSLLLLIRENQNRSSVFTVALDRFDPTNVRQLQAFPHEGDFFDEFVYLPR